MTHIGERIRQRRIELGLTQEELANKLGYTNKSTIGKIETGVNDIVQSKVVDFAVALNTTPAFLMGWDIENNNTSLPIVELFNELNQEGQEKLLEYAEMLRDSGKYKKSCKSDVLEKNA